MLHQMIHFNQTLLWIIDHVKKNSNTLLVVTADHETGSFGLAYNIHSRPKGITISSSNFNKFQFRPNYNFGTHQILDQLYQQKTSFNNMWSEYKKLPEKEKNAKNFQSIINQNSQFKVSLDQTRRILQEQTNPYIRPDHKYLKNKKWPAIKDFRSFYYSPRVARNGLIGRALADQQNVVWGTGSHTATPVLVFSLGPKDTLDQIKGYQTHPQLGQIMQEYLNL
jgi:alkaline phosphatase